MTNNENNKLLAGLVGKHWHEWEKMQVSALMHGWKCECGAQLWKPTNLDFFDPNIGHSKIVELVGKAVERWGIAAFNDALLFNTGRQAPQSVLQLPASEIAATIAQMMEDDNDGK